MIDLTKKLPIKLIDTLNNFNEELHKLRRDIKIESTAGQVSLNGNKYEKISIRYSVKKSSFYFDINFLVNGDYIDWRYYPHKYDSTKPNSRPRIGISADIYSELSNKLSSWKSIITEVTNLKNPLEYFNSDNFIEFYSNEILDQIPTTEEEEKYPLPSQKQKLAIELIEKQSKFLKQEIAILSDSNSDMYNDLQLADKNLMELKEDVKRMTVADVKRKWSLSLGVIVKWCSEKFSNFIKLDNVNGNDISRSIGSFIGGVFGIPKIDQ